MSTKIQLDEPLVLEKYRELKSLRRVAKYNTLRMLKPANAQENSHNEQ